MKWMKVDENRGKSMQNWLKWMKVNRKLIKMVGSGGDGMKMDESGWKLLNIVNIIFNIIDEKIWSGLKWVKMDKSG